MALRILTALALIPIAVGVVWFGPAPLLAALAAGGAILELLEFFELGERLGLHGFRKWTMACAAGLYYAQYVAGFTETREFSGGVSLVRNAAGGGLSNVE